MVIIRSNEVKKEELLMLVDAISRGFWGAYTARFPALVRDLLAARDIRYFKCTLCGIDVACDNCEMHGRVCRFRVPDRA